MQSNGGEGRQRSTMHDRGGGRKSAAYPGGEKPTKAFPARHGIQTKRWRRRSSVNVRQVSATHRRGAAGQGATSERASADDRYFPW